MEGLDRLCGLADPLAEPARTRAAGRRFVRRRPAVWHSQRPPVVREIEDAAQLDLLAGSCLVFARYSLTGESEDRAHIAPEVASRRVHHE